ncbi:MAG TPA: DUF3261 domain-containing protein [Gammaproteobacteria bacterium]|nr:DUF3261 domain-containing protein [Gammaproteobacteria bacterium]
MKPTETCCRSERCSRLLNIAASGRSYVLMLFAATLLAGCATLPPAGCVRLGPDNHFCLLPPAALPQVSAAHLVTIRRNGKRQTFMGRLQINHQALRLAASSLFGAGLFTITWDGHSVTSAPQDARVHPDLIVAMLELAIADPVALRPRLHNLTLKLSHDSEQRDLYAHGRLVADVVTGPKPPAKAYIVMTIPPAHMTLVLRPLKEPKP